MQKIITGAGARQPALLLLALLLLLPGAAQALDGGESAGVGHFGIVGTLSPDRNTIGQGFPAVQISPHWVLTAGHVAPAVGAIFANDYGMSGVAEIRSLRTLVPTVSPIAGAARDDMVLVRLAREIASPYFPILADEDFLPHRPFPAGRATQVSNNPSLRKRRYAYCRLQWTARVPGYSLALAYPEEGVMGGTVVSGDSGSPLFFEHLTDSNEQTILLGVASAHLKEATGQILGLYTRLGAYRKRLEAAAASTGDVLVWTQGAYPGLL